MQLQEPGIQPIPLSVQKAKLLSVTVHPPGNSRYERPVRRTATWTSHVLPRRLPSYPVPHEWSEYSHPEGDTYHYHVKHSIATSPAPDHLENGLIARLERIYSTFAQEIIGDFDDPVFLPPSASKWTPNAYCYPTDYAGWTSHSAKQMRTLRPDLGNPDDWPYLSEPWQNQTRAEWQHPGRFANGLPHASHTQPTDETTSQGTDCPAAGESMNRHGQTDHLRPTPHNVSRLAGESSRSTSDSGYRSERTSSTITQPPGLHDAIDPYTTANSTGDMFKTSVTTETRICLTIDGEVVYLENPELFSRAGSFGDVYVGHHPILGALALKRPRGLDQKYIQSFLAEAKILQRLRHRHVLTFIAAIDSSPDLWLVSPFMGNGNLPSYLKLNPRVSRVPLVFQLASAIAYLHQEGVVHGDIKGANILISADGEVRLCDFGLSKSVRDGAVTDSGLKGAGSLRYQAPELLGLGEPTDTSGEPEVLDVHKTYASDTYAFGMTIYEIISEKAPLGRRKFFHHFIEAIKNGERPPKEPTMSVTGESYESVWVVAEKCWQHHPSNRPNMDNVCKYWKVPVEPALNG